MAGNQTEEDTFRILARPAVDKMVAIYRKEKKEYPGKPCSLDNIAICRKYGWRWEEFLRAKGDAGLSLYEN